MTFALELPTKTTPDCRVGGYTLMKVPVSQAQTLHPNPLLETSVQPQIRALVVSAELELRRPLVRILGTLGADVVVCNRLGEAEEILSRASFDTVFCDEHLPDGVYSDLIHGGHSGNTIPRVILMTRQGDWDLYFQALAKGAFDVIRCPCRSTDVEMTLIRAAREGGAFLGVSA